MICPMTSRASSRSFQFRQQRVERMPPPRGRSAADTHIDCCAPSSRVVPIAMPASVEQESRRVDPGGADFCHGLSGWHGRIVRTRQPGQSRQDSPAGLRFDRGAPAAFGRMLPALAFERRLSLRQPGLAESVSCAGSPGFRARAGGRGRSVRGRCRTTPGAVGPSFFPANADTAPVRRIPTGPGASRWSPCPAGSHPPCGLPFRGRRDRAGKESPGRGPSAGPSAPFPRPPARMAPSCSTSAKRSTVVIVRNGRSRDCHPPQPSVPYAVSVDADAAVFVEIVRQQTGISLALQNRPFTVEYMKFSGYGTDSLCRCSVSHQLAVLAAPAVDRRKFQLFAALRDRSSVEIESRDLSKFIRVVKSTVIEPERELPDCPLHDGGGVGKVFNPMFMARNLQSRLKISGPSERGTDRGDLVAEPADFPARPDRWPQFANLDRGSRSIFCEHFRRSNDDPDGRFVEEGFRYQFVPVDVHYALVGFSSARRQANAVTQFVGGESPEPLFTERQPVMRGRTLTALPLLMTMVVAGNEPDGPDQIESHALAVVGDGDGGTGARSQIEPDDDIVGVCVVGVLDQFEDRQPRTADQLVAEELQQPCARPERLADFSGHQWPAAAPSADCSGPLPIGAGVA